MDLKKTFPNYYDEEQDLHWNPNIKRNGLGTLLKKVRYITISVQDLKKSLEFYTKIMGFQVINRKNNEKDSVYLILGNVELHLLNGIPVVQKKIDISFLHVSLETNNIEEVHEKLVNMGVDFVKKKFKLDETGNFLEQTQLFVRDPDGYYYELCDCGFLTEVCLNFDRNKFLKTDSNEHFPDYYNDKEKLCWNTNEERKGLGTLLRKVNHITFLVKDFEASLEFYTNIIGLQVIHRPNYPDDGIFLTMGNMELHILKGDPVVPDEKNLIFPHICLVTDNIEEVIEKLVKMNIKFSKKVINLNSSKNDLQHIQLVVRDPDGYCLKFENDLIEKDIL